MAHVVLFACRIQVSVTNAGGEQHNFQRAVDQILIYRIAELDGIGDATYNIAEQTAAMRMLSDGKQGD